MITPVKRTIPEH